MERCKEGLAIISAAAFDNNNKDNKYRVKAFAPALIEYASDNCLSTVVEIIPSESMSSCWFALHVDGDSSSPHYEYSYMLQTSPYMQYFMIYSASRINKSKHTSSSASGISLLQPNVENKNGLQITMTYNDDYFDSYNNNKNNNINNDDIQSQEFRLTSIDTYMDLNANEPKGVVSWELELKLIFCTDEHYERRLNVLASTVARNRKRAAEDNIPQDVSSSMSALQKMLLQNLQGRFVKSGSMLSMELPQLFREETEVAIFLVNHVRRKDVVDNDDDVDTTDEDTATANFQQEELKQHEEESLTYRLSGCDSISLLLVSDMDMMEDDEEEVSSMITTQTETTMISQGKSSGYNKLLNEVVECAQISNLAASPSAVLLHGCSGVGKTSLVREHSSRLLQHVLKISLSQLTYYIYGSLVFEFVYRVS